MRSPRRTAAGTCGSVIQDEKRLVGGSGTGFSEQFTRMPGNSEGVRGPALACVMEGRDEEGHWHTGSEGARASVIRSARTFASPAPATGPVAQRRAESLTGGHTAMTGWDKNPGSAIDSRVRNTGPVNGSRMKDNGKTDRPGEACAARTGTRRATGHGRVAHPIPGALRLPRRPHHLRQLQPGPAGLRPRPGAGQLRRAIRGLPGGRPGRAAAGQPPVRPLPPDVAPRRYRGGPPDPPVLRRHPPGAHRPLPARAGRLRRGRAPGRDRHRQRLLQPGHVRPALPLPSVRLAAGIPPPGPAGGRDRQPRRRCRRGTRHAPQPQGRPHAGGRLRRRRRGPRTLPSRCPRRGRHRRHRGRRLPLRHPAGGPGHPLPRRRAGGAGAAGLRGRRRDHEDRPRRPRDGRHLGQGAPDGPGPGPAHRGPPRSHPGGHRPRGRPPLDRRPPGAHHRRRRVHRHRDRPPGVGLRALHARPARPRRDPPLRHRRHRGRARWSRSCSTSATARPSSRP